MIKTLTILSAFVAIAGPASAGDITVSLVGKTPAAIHADIERAAATACREAYASSALGFYQTSQCVADTVRETQAKLDAATTAAAPGQLASTR